MKKCCDAQNLFYSAQDDVCCALGEIAFEGTCCNPRNNKKCCNHVKGAHWDSEQHKCVNKDDGEECKIPRPVGVVEEVHEEIRVEEEPVQELNLEETVAASDIELEEEA